MSAVVRARALGSDPVAEEAAQEFLAQGGSAVGAALAGFFAAAGAHAGVLWGPLSLLVAGVGVGARAFDGRLLQPGLGIRRPRGVQLVEPLPKAAKVAAPGAIAAALVAHAYDGGQRLGKVMKAGLLKARQSGAEGRHELLGRIRGAGALALRDPAFVRELSKVAGPIQGGLLSSQDLKNHPDIDHPTSPLTIDGHTVLRAPWWDDLQEGDAEVGVGHALIAIDVRGACAALSYRRVVVGLTVESMDLELPLAAIAVRPNVPRTPPGTRIRCATPIQMRVLDEVVVEIDAQPTSRLPGSDARPRLRLVRDPRTRDVAAYRDP